jgi:oligopeptide/dipeptide ABC transporter ATP-binding protein
MIRLRDLTVEFRRSGGSRVPGLRSVTIELGEGERVGLVGESGSGKSLTGLACLGLIPESGAHVGGRIELDSADARELSATTLARWRGGTVGLAFQEASDALNPVYTVGFQLIETIRSHRRIGRAEARTRSLELLRAVALEPPEDISRAYPHQLSGGQAQRAMLALAVAGEPRLLIADEPTSGLDLVTRREILQLIARLADERRLGLLLISHDLAAIRDVVDRILVMYAGEIVEEGPAADILRLPLHPYSRELMRAAEWRLETPADDRMPVAEELAPPAATGCSFRTRCPHARPSCGLESPKLTQIGRLRSLRCPVVAADFTESSDA